MANERRFEVLKKAIEDAKTPVSSSVPPNITQKSTRAVPLPLNNNFQVFAAQEIPRSTVAYPSQEDLKAENAAYEELQHYSHLIAALLAEVDAVKYQLEADLRQDLKDGLVELHGRQLPLLELGSDRSAVRDAFEGLLPVSSTTCPILLGSCSVVVN